MSNWRLPTPSPLITQNISETGLENLFLCVSAVIYDYSNVLCSPCVHVGIYFNTFKGVNISIVWISHWYSNRPISTQTVLTFHNHNGIICAALFVLASVYICFFFPGIGVFFLLCFDAWYCSPFCCQSVSASTWRTGLTFYFASFRSALLPPIVCTSNRFFHASPGDRGWWVWVFLFWSAGILTQRPSG